MHWKLKAQIQNAVSLLPPSASYAAYYWLQRRFGALRRIDTTSRLNAGIETWKRIQECGHNNGLFIHRIDYSDHFSHSDSNISAINFLQYGDNEWEGYAGNRYMYMNRLRHDDFINLFQSVRHRIVEAQTDIDQRSRELLRSGNLDLNERFSSNPNEILAITGSSIITQKDS